MPWGQNNDSLAAFSWRKKKRWKNLSYFNLNSTEDCVKRGRGTSFIVSTFDQCFLTSFVPSELRETGIFRVSGCELLVNRAGYVRTQGWVVPLTQESSGGCWMQTQLSCASEDDCIGRNSLVLKITDNLHIIVSVGLEWAVRRKDHRVWSLVMSKKSLLWDSEGQNIILHQTWTFCEFLILFVKVS